MIPIIWGINVRKWESEMTLNVLGIVLLALVLLSCICGLFFACIRKPKPMECVISEQEDERFLEESIAIQPNNSPVFEDTSVSTVIKIGIKKMSDESYNMLQGVNLDV